MGKSGGLARVLLFLFAVFFVVSAFVSIGLAIDDSGAIAAPAHNQVAMPPLRTDSPQPLVMSDASLKTGEQVKVRYDHDTGVPAFISGAMSPPAGDDPLAKSLAFFQVNRELFRMSNPHAELALKRQVVDDIGMTHVQMDQQYKGIPVFGANMAVHFSKDGKIAAVNGYYVPDIVVDIVPEVTVDTAA